MILYFISVNLLKWDSAKMPHSVMIMNKRFLALTADISFCGTDWHVSLVSSSLYTVRKKIFWSEWLRIML